MYYSGWNNENSDNQPVINSTSQQQQQPVPTENRFVPNNSNRGNNRGKGHRGGRGSGPNNWNPHQSGPPPNQLPQQQQMVRD